MRNRFHHIWALVGYVLLSLFLTYPMVLRMGEAIPGDGFDGWQNYWNLWWVKEALVRHCASPFFTDFLYYPEGTSLYFHTLNPFNGLLALPIQQAMGLTLGYNLVVLFSFVMGGFGAYLLALWWIERTGKSYAAIDWAGAFLAGIVFTFSPFHFAHLLGHLQVVSLEWIPFYVLFFLRACLAEEGSKGGVRSRWVGYSLPAAIFLSLIALCDWYYVLYVILFSLFYCGYRAWIGKAKRWASLFQAAIIFALFGALFSPILVPMMGQAGANLHLVQPMEEVERLSADLLAFLIPSALHPLWGEIGARWSQDFTSSLSERTVFMGYIPMGLAILAAFRRCADRWWALSLGLFGVLSLGPTLHVAGNSSFTPFGLRIPLPYALFHSLVPFVRLSRSVSRLDVMVMLSLGILAGCGLRWLLVEVRQRFGGWRAGRVGAVVGTLVVGGVCFEFLAIPYPMSEVRIDPFYRQLAEERGDFAVLELPMDWDRPEHLLYQTVHGKRLVAGYVSRPDPKSLVKRAPVLQELRDLRPDVIRQPTQEIAASVLRYFGVKYVIIHDRMMPPGGRREATLRVVEEMFGDQTPFYRSEAIAVYAVPEKGEFPFIIIGEGWSPWQRWEGQTVRWMEGESTIYVHSARESRCRLNLALISRGEGLPLEMMFNNAFAARWNLRQGSNEVVLGPLALHEGDNRLAIRAASSEGDIGEASLALSSVELRLVD